MDKRKKSRIFIPDRISSYFLVEWAVLLIIAVSGIIYNVGLVAGPWFEGKMAGILADILEGRKNMQDMLFMVLAYVGVIFTVQLSRYIKRFYVRRFANNVNRRMKTILYRTLIHKSRTSLMEEGTGDVMTKAILDVDDCAEGMRKFTTEVFDTGIALVAYACMLLWYDWRIALMCMIFMPVSYVLAEKMKFMVQKTGAEYKKQSGILSSQTLDRASNAITYRVLGCEAQRAAAYEENLSAYEKAAVRANIWNTVMQPLYRILSMTGVIFILYFGTKNVLGTGFCAWTIAEFTTFMSCFAKLAKKSSSAAKLFNSVHKAQVSWKRICPLLKNEEYDMPVKAAESGTLEVKNLKFRYPESGIIFEGVNFTAQPGQIIGITGPVACGKSTLGKVFLCEYPYDGSISFANKELSDMSVSELSSVVGYLGHDPELFCDTIENNILLGDDKKAAEYAKMVCFDKEIAAMEDGMKTVVGNSGVRLSGGQAQRLALARTLCHMKPVMVLDDPFSALDKATEEKIFANIKAAAANNIVFIISHRLYLFPQMNQVIWMDNGHTVIGTHESVMKQVLEYEQLFNFGSAGGAGDEQ